VDGGDTWRALGAGGPLEQAAVPGANWVTVVIDPDSAFRPGTGHRRIYLCGQSGFFVTEDAGETWTSFEQKLPGFARPSGEPVTGTECHSICDLALLPRLGRPTLFATVALRFAGRAGKKCWVGCTARMTAGEHGARNNGWRPRWRPVPPARSSTACWPPAGPTENDLPERRRGVYKTEDGGESWRSVVKIAPSG